MCQFIWVIEKPRKKDYLNVWLKKKKNLFVWQKFKKLSKKNYANWLEDGVSEWVLWLATHSHLENK